MTPKRKSSYVLIAGSLLLFGIMGCPSVAPGPEAVLAGTWELIASNEPDPRLVTSLLTFDSRGDLAQVALTFDDATTIKLAYPPSTVTVDGDQVHISSTFFGNSLVFDGTLDSESNPMSAAGELTRQLTFGYITITDPQGAATITKQQVAE